MPNDPLFAVPGEMALRMGAYHWERTSLGPSRNWPAPLRTLVRLALVSREPMWISWGQTSTFLYNDACAAVALGGRHPDALGRPTSDVWGDVWPRISKSSGSDVVPFLLPRQRGVEEVFLRFTCTSVQDERSEAGHGGSLWTIADDTEAVVGTRRARLLRDLANGLGEATSEAAALAAVADCLEREPYDLPYTMVFATDGRQHQMVAATGLTPTQAASVPHGFVRDIVDWGSTVTDHEVVVEAVPPGMTWAAGPWDRPATHLVVAPLLAPGRHPTFGVMTAALNPYQPIDPPYMEFVTIVTTLLAASLGSAHSRDGDRLSGGTPASLGHELRTPLNAILAWTQVLAAGVDADQQRRGLETIERAARVQARLLDELFAGSSSTANRPAPSDADERPSLPAVDLDPIAVLVVDDDAAVGESTVRTLADAGAEATLASSAAEALECLDERRFDLIVSDLTMPTVDGYSFLVSVRGRSKARGGRTPAIALSSRARSIDRQRALRAGFQMYLAKPVEPGELLLAAASLTGRLRLASN